MEIKFDFTDKNVTPWGGILVIKKFIDKLRVEDVLLDIGLPEQNSNRGYSPVQLIINFWVSVWCGSTKFFHLEVTRQDSVIKEIFGWEKMAGWKTFVRYFGKFNLGLNRELFTRLYKWFFSKIQFDKFTLDFDTSVFTRYGDQEGAAKGYNPNKRGRKSHHPLIAFIPECKMVANFLLRSGDSFTTNNIFSFLEETLLRLEDKKIGLLRADSGFYDHKIFDYLEHRTEPINYIIACKFQQPIKRAISSQKKWWTIDKGIELTEIEYRSPNWSESRRVVIVKQSIRERPKSGGKELRLFDDEQIYGKYRYSAYITNLDLPIEIIWRSYNGRANSENIIKEIKYDFGVDCFNVQNFYATESALNFVIMGFNLISLFRQTMLNSKVNHRMSTLRFSTFGIGAYLIKSGKTKILKLSLTPNRRKWFKALWASCDELVTPLTI